MRPMLIILAVVVFFAAASLVSIYSYGHFARRARGEPSYALPLTGAETRLDREVSTLMEKATGANGLVLLSDNLDAFAVRAQAARHAGRSLDLMYYIWNSDLTGRLLAREVLAAADRGVRVRVLLDDINTRGRDAVYLAFDHHPNITIRLFNPSRGRDGTLRRGVEMALRAFSLNRRMHHKAWIADGRLAVVGGRNVGDEYFDAAEASNFRDLDVLLLGAVVQQTERVFDDYWNSAAALPIRALTSNHDDTLAAIRARLEAQAASEAARPYIDRIADRVNRVRAVAAPDSIHWSDRVEMVSDPPEKALGGGNDNWLIGRLVPVIASARKTLEITSPYFVPGVGGTEWLTSFVAAGVDVAVLTNSLAATDVAVVHGGYARYRVPLLAGGVRLFELQPYAQVSNLSLFGSSAASLHTKAFTVDERTGFIGSLNFDPRSVSLNTEMGVLFDEPVLVAQMRELFRKETEPGMSYRLYLTPDRKLRWEGEAAGGGLRTFDRDPEAKLGRRLLAWIVGLLPLESQL